jgi:predicted RNA-binding Zn ribbon-like protein
MAEDWPQDMLVGGHPALDFLNTVSGQDRAHRKDALGGLNGFRRFAAAAGLADRATGLAAGADGTAFSALIELREDAYAVLAALAEGETPPPAAAAKLDAAISAAIGRATLDFDGQPAWRPAAGPKAAADTAALALHALLAREDLTRLKRCGRCSWLFLDKGRGKGRKWCDMRTCGNRAKAQKHRVGRRQER